MRTALLAASVGAVAIGAINFAWALSEGRGGGIHTATLLITHPLAMLGLGYLIFRYAFPSFMGTRLVDTSTRLGDITSSGQKIAFVRCGGLIGGVNMTSPLLAVSVYPRGISMKPIFMPALAVLGDEIHTVRSTRRFLAARLEIDHTAHQYPSPLVLYLRPEHPVARAITAFASTSGTVEPLPSGAGDPLKPRLVKYTGVTNILIGAGLVASWLLGLTPRIGLIGDITAVFGLIFVAIGVIRLRRSS